MAFRLYVGNYPFNFSEKDVINLFRDFSGLVFEKQCKKGRKCFSFFSSEDIDLLVSVIQMMNNVDVSGRKLIVRAVENSVQDYVDVLLKKTNKDDKNLKSELYSSLVPLQTMKHSIDSLMSNKNDVPSRKETISSSGSYNYEKEKHQPPLEKKVPFSVRALHGSYRQNHVQNSREMLEPVSCSSKSFQDHHQNFKKSYNQENQQIENERPPYQRRKIDKSVQYSENYEENAEDKYSDSNYTSTNSDKNYTSKSDIDFKSLEYPGIWLSVSNFPFYTSIPSIYQLFHDYQPIKVFMVCNTPTKERLLTEAHVCFPNQDIADDVIMNFDNTMYEGRLLLVNDMEDLTVLDELLMISSC